MKIIEVTDFDTFDKLYQKYSKKQDSNETNLIVLFVASDDPDTKQSWCSDCRNSKPVIDKVIEDFKYNEKLILAMVFVGDKETWKNDNNPYRTHPLKLSVVPTLLSLSTVSIQKPKHYRYDATR